MEKNRKNELLMAASYALDEGMSPFDRSFLVDNAVTADECMDLSMAISFAIDWYLMDDMNSVTSVEKLKRWALIKMFEGAARGTKEDGE